MKKKIVILGTSEDQHPLIKKAREMGYETHICGWNLKNVEERIGDYYHEVNIVDYDALWDVVKEIGACGISTCASEIAMRSMNFLLRKMDIPCNSLETEKIASDKYLMRCVMKNAGIDSPDFQLVNEQTTINQLRKFSYPAIIKPVDESSSRGVSKAEKVDDVMPAIKYALEWSKKDKVIMEEYIDGQEYSGESIAYEGNYKLLAITEKTTTGAPHFIEKGHKQPAILSDNMKSKIEKTLYRAFSAMKISYGAIHPEFRITEDGKIYFMEIAARMGGDFIGSELTYLSSGYDFLGMMIDTGCGQAPIIKKTGQEHDAEVRFVISNEDLIELEKIKSNQNINIIRYSKWHEVSDKPVLQNPDRAGYYIFTRSKDRK